MPATANAHSIQITVFTGFLGAGKTSIILSLLPRLPKDYKVVLLKNEFGDIEGLVVDSQLAKQSSLTAVSEILNGCMCCVLVGQMKTALLEIRDKFRPDRIFIECSGSAFPATLAFQIRELERETGGDLKLDAIVTVIDAENFTGYEDTSPTAKMQASYTDLIIINKWEHISERELDILIDHLNTLNDATPKVKSQGREGVDPSVFMGIDSKLFQLGNFEFKDVPHHDEVQTVTIYKGRNPTRNHSSDDGCLHSEHAQCNHEIRESETHPSADAHDDVLSISRNTLTDALEGISKETVWRVKGFVKLNSKYYILNWAFGRYELVEVDEPVGEVDAVRLTVMGERGEVRRASRKFAEKLWAEVV